MHSLKGIRGSRPKTTKVWEGGSQFMRWAKLRTPVSNIKYPKIEP